MFTNPFVLFHRLLIAFFRVGGYTLIFLIQCVGVSVYRQLG